MWNRTFCRRRATQSSHNMCRADSKDIRTRSHSSSAPSTDSPVYWEILAHTQYPSLFRGEICWNKLIPLPGSAPLSLFITLCLLFSFISSHFVNFWLLRLISRARLSPFFSFSLGSSDWLLEWHRQTGAGPEWKRSVQRQLSDGEPHRRRDDHHGNVPFGPTGLFAAVLRWNEGIRPHEVTVKSLKNVEMWNEKTPRGKSNFRENSEGKERICFLQKIATRLWVIK